MMNLLLNLLNSAILLNCCNLINATLRPTGSTEHVGKDYSFDFPPYFGILMSIQSK